MPRAPSLPSVVLTHSSRIPSHARAAVNPNCERGSTRLGALWCAADHDMLIPFLMLKYAIVRFKDAKYIRIHSLFEFEHVCFQILGAFVLA